MVNVQDLRIAMDSLLLISVACLDDHKRREAFSIIDSEILVIRSNKVSSIHISPLLLCEVIILGASYSVDQA
jgi:hypothetical protein